VPDPLQGSIPVVGIGWVPYAVNVTVDVAAALGVTNWAVIERPREPVAPANAVDGAGDDTSTVCPPAGWPIWPRRRGPGHTTSTEALACWPLTRPINVWCGAIVTDAGCAPATAPNARLTTAVTNTTPDVTRMVVLPDMSFTFPEEGLSFPAFQGSALRETSPAGPSLQRCPPPAANQPGLSRRSATFDAGNPVRGRPERCRSDAGRHA